MKKTLTRALSLILVLVALLGVMPTAFALEENEMAAKAMTVNETAATLKVGEEHQITVTGLTTQNDDQMTTEEITATYESSDATVASVDATGKVSALKAGTATITVTGKGTRSGWSYTHVGTATVAITVEADETTETPEYTVTLAPATLEVAVEAESEALDVVVSDGTINIASSNYTIKGWASSDTTVATVNDGVVTGVKEGTAEITAVVTIGDKDYTSAKCTVTVTKEDAFVLECDNVSKKMGDTVILEPTLKVNGTTATNVAYEFTKKAGNNKAKVETNNNKGIVTTTVAGLVEVEVKVKSYKLGSTTVTDVDNIEPLVVLVRFYDTPNVELTLANGKTRVALDDTKIFSKVVVNSSDRSTFYKDYSFQYIFEQLLPTPDMDKADKIKFTNLSTSAPGQLIYEAGTFSYTQPWKFIGQVLFDQVGSRTGATMFNFEILDENEMTLLKGTCTITITGGKGDIHYETTYNKPITLKEIDFQTFWTNQGMGSMNTLLNHVTFDTAGMTGKLYTDSTKKTLVLNTMKFYIAPSAGQYDLGSVCYVPDSTKTSEYMDSFNFTINSNYTEYRSGSVTVELNAKSTSITSRGVVFSTTYSKNIKDAYATNTGANLGYVVFELPEAKYGKLYSKLPSELKTVHGTSMTLSYVATGTEMKYGDKMWYDSNKAETRGVYLATVAYVPAAGFKGEVALKYTAYDTTGGNAYQGTLRFNVSTKTASAVFSDVTARSYSWAADSADFLFYEGVAQGSKAAGSTQIKYNPSANITRQDFMLMLYRAFLANNYSTFNVTTNFPDVVKGADAYSKEIYQAVGVAKYLGIAQGTNDKFNPKSNITRQEAMVLIYRTLDVIKRDLDYTAGVNAAIFKDYNKVSNWAATAIIYLVNHGVIQGSNDMINPTANITRAEMACILHRVLTY